MTVDRVGEISLSRRSEENVSFPTHQWNGSLEFWHSIQQLPRNRHKESFLIPCLSALATPSEADFTTPTTSFGIPASI